MMGLSHVEAVSLVLAVVVLGGATTAMWVGVRWWVRFLVKRDNHRYSVDSMIRADRHAVAAIELGKPRMPGDRRVSALEIHQRDVRAGDLVMVSGMGWHGRPMTHRAVQNGPDDRWLPTDTVYLVERPNDGRWKA